MNTEDELKVLLEKYDGSLDFRATTLEILNALCRISPDNTSYKLRYADTARSIGRRSDALAVLTSIKPKTANDHYILNVTLGEYFRDIGEWESALFFFQSAITNNPLSFVPYVYAASCLSQKGRFPEAIQILFTANKIAGENDEIFENIGNYYRALGNLDSAIEFYRKALSLSSEPTEIQTSIKDLETLKQIRQVLGE